MDDDTRRIRRRALLSAGVIGAVGLVLPRLLRRSRTSSSADATRLRPDPAGILELREGFSYHVLEHTGDLMGDGRTKAPAMPDGMGCFPGPNGTLVLMRNHAIERGGGGVSRLVVQPGHLERVTSHMVLTGTSRNCPGGVSPWGWLSCEASEEPGHGYVYVCSPQATGLEPPRRLAGYGRFMHGAAAVDPATSICYLTEDRGDACLYRFVPRAKANPFEGQLQALKVAGASEPVDTDEGWSVGQSWPVEWVDIEEPEPPKDRVRFEAHRKGAAYFSRLEGAWFADGAVYVSATEGGPVAGGQIFRLRIGRGAADTLELVAQSQSRDQLDMPDNITVAPWSDLYLGEDGYGSGGEDFIRAISPSGKMAPLARSVRGEIAGLCFSPGGDILFANLPHVGLTVALRGPFRDLTTGT